MSDIKKRFWQMIAEKYFSIASDYKEARRQRAAAAKVETAKEWGDRARTRQKREPYEVEAYAAWYEKYGMKIVTGPGLTFEQAKERMKMNSVPNELRTIADNLETVRSLGDDHKLEIAVTRLNSLADALSSEEDNKVEAEVDESIEYPKPDNWGPERIWIDEDDEWSSDVIESETAIMYLNSSVVDQVVYGLVEKIGKIEVLRAEAVVVSGGGKVPAGLVDKYREVDGVGVLPVDRDECVEFMRNVALMSCVNLGVAEVLRLAADRIEGNEGETFKVKHTPGVIIPAEKGTEANPHAMPTCDCVLCDEMFLKSDCNTFCEFRGEESFGPVCSKCNNEIRIEKLEDRLRLFEAGPGDRLTQATGGFKIGDIITMLRSHGYVEPADCIEHLAAANVRLTWEDFEMSRIKRDNAAHEAVNKARVENLAMNDYERRYVMTPLEIAEHLGGAAAALLEKGEDGIPERIYLVGHGGEDEVTWAGNRVNDDDIEYTRQAVVVQCIDGMKATIDRLREERANACGLISITLPPVGSDVGVLLSAYIRAKGDAEAWMRDYTQSQLEVELLKVQLDKYPKAWQVVTTPCDECGGIECNETDLIRCTGCGGGGRVRVACVGCDGEGTVNEFTRGQAVYYGKNGEACVKCPMCKGEKWKFMKVPVEPGAELWEIDAVDDVSRRFTSSIISQTTVQRETGMVADAENCFIDELSCESRRCCGGASGV